MKLFVPSVGTRLRLSQDWKFELYNERRNGALHKAMGIPYNDAWWTVPRTHVTVTLPAGTLLEVDRVYIRTTNKGARSADANYDSLTFRVIEHPTWGNKKHPRFWAKLAEVNTIEYVP